MREGISFRTKLKGFAQEDAIITGVEASSPVRMERKDSYESINMRALS